MAYQIIEASSTDGGALTISLPWEFELSEVQVVAENATSGASVVYKGAGTLTVDRDGNLVVPALFGGDAFRIWISRETEITHDYDSSGDVIDDKTIDAELKELVKRSDEARVETERAVKLPDGDDSSGCYLPSKEKRAGHVFGFDETGTPAVGDTVPEVATIYSARTEAVNAARGALASETNAKQSENSALASKNSAASSASIATDKANIATTAATSASNDADRAEAAKEGLEEAQQAAAESASAAADSATAANTSRVNAKASETAAKTSQTAAATSANNASQSASAAKASETNAKASETASKASETASANNASSAATSATNAANSASSASASATNAGNSATAAAESAEQAAQSAEALANVYTKQEVDSALAVRDTNIAANAANIDWLKIAIDGDWKTYMLARAGMTGIQKNIDTVNRAIKEYNADNTSALAARLIEDWDVLYWHEFERGIRLDSVFWVAYFEALARWEADPDGVVDWSTVSNGDGTYTYNCPYHDAPATSPVVELRAVNLRSSETYKGAMHPTISQPWYTPNTTSLYFAFAATKITAPVILRNTESLYRAFWLSDYNLPIRIAVKKSVYEAFRSARSFNSVLIIETEVTNWSYICDQAIAFDRVLDMSKASAANNAFAYAGMSAESISGTLDTLPAYTSGTHVITFTGCPGAAELTQDSPSVAAAVARGWTVEL